MVPSLIETIESIYSSKEKALELVHRVAAIHCHDKSMMDYRFFEEQAAFACSAADSLVKKELTPKQKEDVEYINKKIKPYFRACL